MIEAIGFEEMLRRDKERRRVASTQVEQNPTEKHSGTESVSLELNSATETAMIRLSPPEVAGFEQLFAEINFTNMVLSNVEDNVLTIKSPSYNISMSVRMILEILAQQMKTPINLPSELNIKSAPPFITNIKQITDYYISEMLCEYQKIFRLNDPRIEKLCHDYFISLSYPITVRLAYLNWENKQMGWKVGLAVKEIKSEYLESIRKNRNDYAKQLEEKTTIMKTQMNRAQSENRELMTKLQVMNERLENLKMDTENRAGEVNETHIKLKLEQSRIEELQKQMMELRKENQALQTKIGKQKEGDEWVQDMSSMDEMPVWRNRISKEIKTLPTSIDTFKSEYKLKTIEDDICKYSKDDGTAYEMPESLADKLMTELKNGANSTASGAGKEKIEPNLELREKYEKACLTNPSMTPVYESILNSNNPLSQVEISAAAGVSISNIKARCLQPLLTLGLILEVRDNERRLRYTPSAQRI